MGGEGAYVLTLMELAFEIERAASAKLGVYPARVIAPQSSIDGWLGEIAERGCRVSEPLKVRMVPVEAGEVFGMEWA